MPDARLMVSVARSLGSISDMVAAPHEETESVGSVAFLAPPGAAFMIARRDAREVSKGTRKQKRALRQHRHEEHAPSEGGLKLSGLSGTTREERRSVEVTGTSARRSRRLERATRVTVLDPIRSKMEATSSCQQPSSTLAAM